MEPEQTSPFTEVKNALSGSETRAEPRLPNETVLAVARLVADGKSEADELSALVFPTGVPSSVEFYERLRSIVRKLGSSSSTASLAAELAAFVLKKVPEESRTTILQCLPATENRDFFGSLRLLPVIIERVTYPADVLLPCLLALRAKIGNDMAQGDYWKSIEAWASTHPSEALEGLRLLCNYQLDDDKISIGACLLGHLRVAWEQGASDCGGKALETAIADGVGLPAYFTVGEGDLALAQTLRRFVAGSRKEYPFTLPLGVPPSALVLACIKHVSPLPSEFWRAGLFDVAVDKEQPATENGDV